MMHFKVTGLVLLLTPFREKDVIVHLLLKSGKKISVICYGARGSGRSKKRATNGGPDLGVLFSAWLRKGRFQEGQEGVSDTLFHCYEWTIDWRYIYLRDDYQAYYLLCFYLELIGKIAQPCHLRGNNPLEFVHEEIEESEDFGLFRVLSNALFYLEGEVADKRSLSLEKKALSELALFEHSLLFMIKVIFELGITPILKSCLSCQNSLEEAKGVDSFLILGGGFLCFHCGSHHVKYRLEKERNFYEHLASRVFLAFNEIKIMKYRERRDLFRQGEEGFAREMIELIYRYLCSHLNYPLQKFTKSPFMKEILQPFS